MLKEEIALGQTLLAELEHLTRDEIEGGWRGLCAMMLLRTANLLTTKLLSNKDYVYQRQQALRWLDSGDGTISFSSACDTLDVDEKRIRLAMRDIAGDRGGLPINTAASPRFIFGKPTPCQPSPISAPCLIGRPLPSS